MVRATQREGHAFNDGRIVSAMAAVGVPVKDRDGRALAALSLAAIRERMDRRAWPSWSRCCGRGGELGRRFISGVRPPAEAAHGKLREEQF